jgi:hypothetical protein
MKRVLVPSLVISLLIGVVPKGVAQPPIPGPAALAPAPPPAGAAPPPPGAAPSSIQNGATSPSVSGTVKQYLLTPVGEVEGVELQDGTDVRFPAIPLTGPPPPR